MNYTIKSFEEAVLAIQKKVQSISNQELFEHSWTCDYYGENDEYDNIFDYLMTYEYEKRLHRCNFLTEKMKPFTLEYKTWMKFDTPIWNELHKIDLPGQMIRSIYDGKDFGHFGVYSQDFDINTTLITDLQFEVDENGNKKYIK